MKQFSAVLSFLVLSLFAMPLMAGPPIGDDIKVEVANIQMDEIQAPAFMPLANASLSADQKSVDTGPPAMYDMIVDAETKVSQNQTHYKRRWGPASIQNTDIKREYPRYAISYGLRC